jgi:RNA recognition motif-containing protein
MAKKVYVGNLNYQTTEDTLRELFAEYGDVDSVNLITDRYSGRSRGFAFVEMADDDAAQAAITDLNGKTVDEWELRVAEAKPRTDRPTDRRGGDRW